MKLWRSLAIRILGISILCGVVAHFAQIQLNRKAQFAVSEDVFQQFAASIWAREQSRCEQSPSGWSVPFLGTNGELFAFDANGRSSNPGAPAFERDLVPVGKTSVLRYTAEGGVFQTTVAGSGPCTTLQARWVKTDSRRRRIWMAEVFLPLAIIAFAVCASVLFVVVPLLRRVLRLERAARRVGGDDYASAESAGGDELGSLSRSLDAAHGRIRADVEALARHRERLEEFLSEVAHDLRTPLGSVRLGLEHLSNARATGGEAEADDAQILERALRDVVYVSALADNLRLSHQLKSGWHPADTDVPTDFGDVVDRAVNRARVFARHRGMQVEGAFPEHPVPVRCNLAAAEQLVTNLVENAIHHGRRGGNVSVVLESVGSTFTLLVKDDGVAVGAADLARLTDRTFRGEGAGARHAAGTGLGLAIVSEVCARCDWCLSFRALSPVGLEVRVDGA